MKQLLNNCRAGKFAVHPKNWQAKNASTKSWWYITYRFYDDNLHCVKLIKIQGMNHLTDLNERQNCTKIILENELHNLQKGFNPVTCRLYTPPVTDVFSIVTPKTPFCEALNKAQLSLNLEGATKDDMNWIISRILDAAPKVYLDNEYLDEIPIGNIKKRHIRALLNYLSDKYNLSNHAWNKFRTYLMILFKELSEYDAVEYNVPKEISKRKTVKKLREVLSEDERKKVREYLLEHNYRFWLFLNIFFHSGARIREFFRMKIKDIDLARQTMKVTILKGKQYVEVIKPIKNIAIPYWEEYLSGFENKRNFYIMGEGLVPAEVPTRYDQINKRWLRIKKRLNITADFYSLKHLNTDQIAEQIGIQYAQKLNSHTNLATTKIYAVNQQQRDMEMIKSIENEF